MNKLEAARRALTEQIAAREQAEQLLQEARTTIETLETKLTHERIAKEEAVREVEDQRRRVSISLRLSVLPDGRPNRSATRPLRAARRPWDGRAR